MNRAVVPAPAARRRRRAAWAAAGVIAATASMVLAAEPVTVRRATAKVLDQKGSAGEAVDTVARGTSLQVVGREGHWLRVRTPSGKVGYLSESYTQEGSETANVTGQTGNTVSPTDAAAAGRGLDQEVVVYASDKGLSTAGLEKMEATAAACRGGPHREFEQQGHVGSAAR